MIVERPRAKRYGFVAAIEIVDLQSDLRVHARITDLSLYGCGVSATKPFPAGTRVRIRITYNGAKFEALGRVTYATADSYMGILFGRVETKDQLVLEKWVAELRDK